MLKRKILAAVLPVVAAGTVVGSGFSAWYFGSIGGDGYNPSFSVEVTPGTKNGGTFKAYWNSVSSDTSNEIDNVNDKAKLVLDQGTYDNLNDENAGISFMYTKDTGANPTYTNIDKIIFVYQNADFKILSDAGLSVKVSFSIELDEKLSKFVQFKLADNVAMDNNFCTDIAMSVPEENTAKTKIEGSVTLSTGAGNYNELSMSWTWVFNFMESQNYVTQDYQNKLLKYYNNSDHGQVTEGQTESNSYAKPNNLESHKKMKELLANSELSFSASYSIE